MILCFTTVKYDRLLISETHIKYAPTVNLINDECFMCFNGYLMVFYVVRVVQTTVLCRFTNVAECETPEFLMQAEPIMFQKCL